MFGINWSDPETLWLNLTNAGLGLVTLICLGYFFYGVALEIRARRRTATEPDMDRKMAEMLKGIDPTHAFYHGELGVTMADGGEPEAPKAKPKPKTRKG